MKVFQRDVIIDGANIKRCTGACIEEGGSKRREDRSFIQFTLFFQSFPEAMD
jgi:hypothetical protein